MANTPIRLPDDSSDGRWSSWLIEVFRGSSLRDLRLVTLKLAYRLAQDNARDLCGLVLLVDSRISKDALDQESERMRAVLKKDLIGRISFLHDPPDTESHFSRTAAPDGLQNSNFKAYLAELIRGETAPTRSYGSAPGNGKSVVLELLILSWLRNEGPLSTTDVQRRAGVSYPTAAGAIKELEATGALGRGYNRSVELKRFPWTEWRNWLARTSTSRKTVLYAPSTHLPVAPLRLLDRLAKLKRIDVAVGGTLGAAKHYPRLDVVGTSRLDLVVLGEPQDFSEREVARLDSGLEAYRGDPSRAVLAMHFIGRRKGWPFLVGQGIAYADPLNCLADLYEMGLTAQASEMLQHLVDVRSVASASAKYTVV